MTATAEVVCGVCGGLHPVPLVTGSYTCPRQNHPYTLVVGSLDAVVTRAEGGRLLVEVRGAHDGQHDFWEWSVPPGQEIAAEAGDAFALAMHLQRITAFHNLSLGRTYVFRRRVPGWLRCAGWCVLALALAYCVSR